MIAHCFVLFYCHYSVNSYFPSGYFYVLIVCISSWAKCFFLSLAIFSLYYTARSPKICGRQTGDTGEPMSSLGLSPKAWQVGESMLLTPIRKFAGSSPKKGQYFNLSSKEGKDWCSSSTVKQKFPLTQPFCSMKIDQLSIRASREPLHVTGVSHSMMAGFSIKSSHVQTSQDRRQKLPNKLRIHLK